MTVALWQFFKKQPKRWAIVEDMRVRIIGTPFRGVVAERYDDVCLVLLDDTTKPERNMYHVDELEID